jgi:hypothetical protein
MSEYELLESFTSFQGLLQGWITAFFSGTTACLVAAYFAQPGAMWATIANGAVVIVVSVKFMWDIRRRRAGSPQDR